MEKVIADRKLQMKRHEPVLTSDDENALPVTYNMKSLLSLVPIGLILFIMLFSAAIYYFLTGMMRDL